MTPRAAVGILLVAVVAAAGGALAGYAWAQHRAQELDLQRRDLMTAIRATDLQNRLTMLRMMREQRVSDEDIRSLEISAIALLGTIALDEVNEASQSQVVLKRAAKDLATYTRDFPNAEFSDSRHRKVIQLLAVVGSK